DADTQSDQQPAEIGGSVLPPSYNAGPQLSWHSWHDSHEVPAIIRSPHPSLPGLSTAPFEIDLV
ncbi:hypothetical protein FRC02_003588, partial [Tulasnella sp. 418]